LILLNLIFPLVPTTLPGRITAYNRIFPGRPRFPFGENPAQAYNLNLFDLDAMFAAHLVADRSGTADELRVFLIGDSSVWGTLQRPEETLAGLINQQNLVVCGKQVTAYNLGYPTISLMKDLLILDYALEYQPDLIIWLVTLEAFPMEKQLTSPIVANNPDRIREIIQRYDLPLDPQSPGLVELSYWGRTILGQRRALADLIRHQMYGVLWSATGIDQSYPADYPPAATDFGVELDYYGWRPESWDPAMLFLAALDAGVSAAGDVPLIVLNEPMLISQGENSDLRYNFFYPRWVYDRYRIALDDHSRQSGWTSLDLWDLIPASEYYTNSAIHLTPAGERLLSAQVSAAISGIGCP